MIEGFGTPLKVLYGFDFSMPDTGEKEWWVQDPMVSGSGVTVLRLLESALQVTTLFAVQLQSLSRFSILSSLRSSTDTSCQEENRG